VSDDIRTSPPLPPEERPEWRYLRPMPASRVSQRHPIIVGHRGASGLAPENTLAAFRVAAELGVDGIEFDVQRTADGELIVFHDDELERVTDGSGLVYEKTLAEVKALDAGRWFGAAFAGERVPTLAETFELCRGTDLLLFIELKDPWRFPGVEAAVVEMIRAFDLQERVQIRSFYHAALHVVHHVAPEIALSELWFDHLPTDDEVTFKTINAFYPLYTLENIAHIHARGQQATAWTVNDLDVARALIDAGIDGLTTDYPDRLLTLFEA